MQVRFPGGALQVEVADTPAKRAQGLMHRAALAPDQGMLFVMAQQAPHAFWMRSVLIPLDMIFLDEQGIVVGLVEHAPPQDDRRWGPKAASSYVVETNAGWARAHGVALGQKVWFG